MPEMHFLIEWPGGEQENCYSPSYIIEEHLTVGQSYGTGDFLERVRRALEIASERVRQRYGFVCTSALDQLASIETKIHSLSLAERDGHVKVLAFDKHPARDARAKPLATGGGS
jgi:uncharacterized repeat protein (TIGR04042 family)